MRLNDSSNGYGWVSIALHWGTAAIVIAMWTIGALSQGNGRESDIGLVHLHTSIGMTAYALLWARIIWRCKVGHPGPRSGQNSRLFLVAKIVHYLLLVALGMALLSGPLTVWTAGDAIAVFSFTIPSPSGSWPELHRIARDVHGITTLLILAGIVLHVLAVVKHMVVNRDGTFDKMMVADRGS